MIEFSIYNSDKITKEALHKFTCFLLDNKNRKYLIYDKYSPGNRRVAGSCKYPGITSQRLVNNNCWNFTMK